MPIARFQLEDGRIARFDVPEGTTPGQAQEIGTTFFAQQEEKLPKETPKRRAGDRGRSSRIASAKRAETQDLLVKFEAGEITSSDLSTEQVESVRKARIEKIPELTGSFKKLSGNLGFTQALAALTAFDPDEFGKILTKADPDIGIVITPDGERIAINRKTDEGFSINKLGPSLIDAVQIGGVLTAFGPAGAVKTLTGITVASGVTQAAIEAGQKIAGGEFDVAPVVGAAVGVPIVAKGLQLAQSFIKRIRPTQPPTTIPEETLVKQLDVIPEEGLIKPTLDFPEEEAVSKAFTPLLGSQSKSSQEVRKAIEQGNKDNITAKYIIDGFGKIRKDPAAQEVIAQGFSEGVTAAVKGSSAVDRAAMSKMVDIVKKGRENQTFRLKNRPSDVIGNNLLDRWKIVSSLNKKAGEKVELAARELKGKKVDIDSTVNKFISDLDELGISVAGDLKPTFGPLSVGKIPAAKKFIENTLDDLTQVKGDALNAHKLKKLIDEQVSFGKVGEGITGKTEAVIKNLRRNINESLKSEFPKYKKANNQFSETKQALDNFQQAAGKNFDPASPNAEKFTGNLSRRLLSNVQSRAKLMDSITGLEQVSKKFGKKIDDDLFTQVMFADELENLFGSFAPTSIGGIAEKAIVRGGRILTGGGRTLLDIGIEGAAKGVEKARGINEVNALKALKELVKPNI